MDATMDAAIDVRQTRSGFWNLLSRENKAWWGGNRWLLQTLVGVVGLNGFVAFVLFVLPGMAAAAGEEINGLEAGRQLFFGLGAFVLALDVIILTQDTIIGEKQSGTAEWVLSKPVSRTAYVLAKFVANSIGILTLLILLPGVVAYGLFSIAAGEAVALTPFLLALGLTALHTLFYLALSLMMGVLSAGRGALLAVTLGSLFGGALLLDFFSWLAFVTPWSLPNVAGAIASGVSLPPQMWIPAAVTAGLTLVAVAVAVWRFRYAEL